MTKKNVGKKNSIKMAPIVSNAATRAVQAMIAKLDVKERAAQALVKKARKVMRAAEAKRDAAYRIYRKLEDAADRAYDAWDRAESKESEISDKIADLDDRLYDLQYPEEAQKVVAKKPTMRKTKFYAYKVKGGKGSRRR